MEFSKIEERALHVRKLFEEFERNKYGRSWTREEIALGFMGDVGDLMKLVLAEADIREIPDSRKKMAHELSDCLWSIIVLAKLYGIDLEKSFDSTMTDLERLLKTPNN